MWAIQTVNKRQKRTRRKWSHAVGVNRFVGAASNTDAVTGYTCNYMIAVSRCVVSLPLKTNSNVKFRHHN